MPFAEIAASHYEPDGQGDARKVLVNYYTEPNSNDPVRKIRLATTPGSRTIGAGTIAGTVRGIFQSDGHAGGKLLVVDGTTVRTMTTDGNETFGTLTGALSGTDRVQAVFAEAEGALLSGGDIYVSTGSAVAQATDADWATLLSDHGQTDFSSLAILGQRLIGSYGSRMGYSLTGDFNNTTTLSFYTAESAPDGIVGLKTLGTTLHVFGTQTIEPWVQTGNDDDPLTPLTGQTIQRGCAGRDTIVELDNSLFFIADDRTVRRLDGPTPRILGEQYPWVSRHLRSVAATDIVCDKIEDEGHAFYIIRTPTACIVYDVLTDQFHLRRSYLEDSWDWKYHQRVGATHYAASDTGLVELSRDYASDDQADASAFGTEIVRQFTAHMPVISERRKITSIRVDGTKGVGLVSGQGSDPQMLMELSKDGGLAYSASRTRSLGKIGEYGARAIWRQCGRFRPEQCVALFTVSDPIKHAITGVAVNVDAA